MPESDVGPLAEVVADEIRNPLTGIFGYAGLLRRRVGSDDQWLKGLEKEAHRIEDIMRTLLDVASLPVVADEGEPVDVNALLRDRARRLVTLHGLGRSDLRLDLSATSLPVGGDAARLGRMIDLLLRTAVRAVEPYAKARIHLASGMSISHGQEDRPQSSGPTTRSHVRVHITARPVLGVDETPGIGGADEIGSRDPDPDEASGFPLGQRMARWLATRTQTRLEVERPTGGGVRYVLMLPSAVGTSSSSA